MKPLTWSPIGRPSRSTVRVGLLLFPHDTMYTLYYNAIDERRMQHVFERLVYGAVSYDMRSFDRLCDDCILKTGQI